MPKHFVQSKLSFSKSGLSITSSRKRPSPFKRSNSEQSPKRLGRSIMDSGNSYAQVTGKRLSGNPRGRGRGFKTEWKSFNSFESPGTSRYYGQNENQTSQRSPDLFEREYDGSNSTLSLKLKASEKDENRIFLKSDLRRAPGCYKNQLPPLTPSLDHTVLFRVTNSGWSDELVPPHPNSYKDMWDDDHVYMPCSNHNVIISQRDEHVSRWKQIEKVLKQPISGIFELEEAILSYNRHYANRWSFDSLREFLLQDKRKRDEFFTYTLPFMQKLALSLPSLVTQPLPILKQGRPSKLTMSQQQAACLLANAFFCTFPKRNARFRSATLPDINFSNLYGRSSSDVSRKVEKLKCIVNYFERVKIKMPTGVITFTRHVLPAGAAPRWDECSLKLTDLYVSSKGNIEDDGKGMLQADFANKFVGGGVLGHGLVQEEIRFVICPEMILSRLFTPVLQDNEVLIMTGCERFNTYTGYSDTFEYGGDYLDETQRDSWGRKYTEVVAMDALHFKTSETQFEEGKILRELNKAYCAFQGTEFTSNLPAVCTGNWGCGAFKGDKHLKALIQLIAASMAGRQVCYFTFDDKTLQRELTKVHGMLCEQNITVKEVYKLIIEYSRRVMKKKQHYWEMTNNQTLFEYIANAMGESLRPASAVASPEYETSRYSADDFESQD